jgi:exodeoxyribonuclease X
VGKIVYIDTETTGLKSPVRAVETAVLYPPYREPEVRLWNPLRDIEAGASAVHGIKQENVAGMPPYTDFALPEGTTVAIAHNARFDAMVIGEPPGVTWVCTLALARKAYPKSKSHKLTDMCAALNLPLLKAHGAGNDVIMCRNLFIYLAAELEFTGNWNTIALDLTGYDTFDFGKHSGRALAEIPIDYLRFASREMELHPILSRNVKEEMERRTC